MKQKIINFHFNIQKKLFCVSDKNNFAFNLINSWPKWNNKNIFIYGPRFCGKTSIAKIWGDKSNALFINSSFFEKFSTTKIQKLIKHKNCWILDDFDELVLSKNNIEERVLNFLNMINEKNDYLLITSKKAPKFNNIKIKDLYSRISSFIVVEVKEPDDYLLKQIILKNLENKQIIMPQRSLNFLLKVIDRTYASAFLISKSIDEKSLEHKKKISIDFIKRNLLKLDVQ